MPPNRRKVKSAVHERPADGHERGRNFLGEAEMARLLKAAKLGRHGVRDHLLLLIMFRHGLRVSEAVALCRADVDLEQARLWISRLKNGLSVEQPIAGGNYSGTPTSVIPYRALEPDLIVNYLTISIC